MPLSPEQQRSIADLVAQVNVDNVLQVAAQLRKQADDISRELYTRAPDLVVGSCGRDPVSLDAQQLFQRKIDQILEVHWRHVEELRAAVEALRQAAHRYGYTDSIIESTFTTLVSSA